MQGHPRAGVMSQRLKSSIEAYIRNELLIYDHGGGSFARRRSKSLVPLSSLVTEGEMKPVCRPRSSSCLERHSSKDRTHCKEKLVNSVNHVSFNQLDK